MLIFEILLFMNIAFTHRKVRRPINTHIEQCLSQSAAVSYYSTLPLFTLNAAELSPPPKKLSQSQCPLTLFRLLHLSIKLLYTICNDFCEEIYRVCWFHGFVMNWGCLVRASFSSKLTGEWGRLGKLCALIAYFGLAEVACDQFVIHISLT